MLFFNREGVDEEFIRSLFSSTGGTVQNFRFFQYVQIFLLITLQFVFVNMN